MVAELLVFYNLQHIQGEVNDFAAAFCTNL